MPRNHTRSLVRFMKSCRKALHLGQKAEKAALQRNADSILDLDELICLLDIASRGSARLHNLASFKDVFSRKKSLMQSCKLSR